MDLKSVSMVWFHMVNLSLHAVASVYLFFLLFQLGRYWLLERRTDVRPEHLPLRQPVCLLATCLYRKSSRIFRRAKWLGGTNYFSLDVPFFAAFVARKSCNNGSALRRDVVCVVMARFVWTSFGNHSPGASLYRCIGKAGGYAMERVFTTSLARSFDSHRNNLQLHLFICLLWEFQRR